MFLLIFLIKSREICLKVSEKPSFDKSNRKTVGRYFHDMKKIKKQL